MSGVQVFLAIGLGLIVNEFTNVSPWLARKLVMWSARLRYGDSSRAQIRAEEWAAVINDRPGNLFKLVTSFRFASAAVATRIRCLVAGVPASEGHTPSENLLSLPVLAPYEEASTLVARYLFPTERFRGEWRRHWIHPTKSVAIIVVYASLGAWAAALRLNPRYVLIVISGIIVVAITLVVFRILGWRLTRFVITNKRIMATEGVLFRRVAMIPLLRVTDMRYEQGPIARLLNYGTFRLESANRRNAMRKISDLPRPDELYLRVVEEMYEPEAVERRIHFNRGVTPADIAEGSSVDDAEGVDAISKTDGAEILLQHGLPHQPRSSRLPIPSVDYNDIAEQVAEVATQLSKLATYINGLTPRSAARTATGDTALTADDAGLIPEATDTSARQGIPRTT